MRRRIGSIGCPVLLAVLFAGTVAADRSAVDVPLVFTQGPTRGGFEIVASEDQGGFRVPIIPGDGCRIVLLGTDGKTRVLTGEFAAACDPCVSFDATRLLFAGKESEDDNWNIWEMGVDGSGARQITRELGDCREPAYLAPSSITAPEFADKVQWIVFTSTAAGTYDESGSEIATALYVQNLEPIEGRGTVTWRTTFNLSHDFSPTVLSDGRVLFSSWQQQGNRHPPYGMVALLTTNWAGTGLNVFHGNHDGALVKTAACEMPDRTLVFVESDRGSADAGGRLASVSFARPLRSHQTLSDGGRYRTPHALPDGRLIVSYVGEDQVYDRYTIYLFDREKRSLGPLVYGDPDWDCYDAMSVVPREEPMGRITIVVDSKDVGHLQCLNVYDSNRPEAKSIEPGAVKWAHFVRGLPSKTGPAATVSLGSAPVEPDGSFYVSVPADTPFYIELLDENGEVLQTMHTWMWVRRGSRRGCVGCHEDKELAPENRATQALLKAEPHPIPAPKPREAR